MSKCKRCLNEIDKKSINNMACRFCGYTLIKPRKKVDLVTDDSD